jgi:hypothetical protein
MKKTIYLAAFIGVQILACLQAQSQENSKTDTTVVLTTKELQELIGKQYYTRIPITDLDKSLDYKISNEIRGRFNSAIALIGSILGLGGLIFGSFLAKGQKDRFTNLSLQLKQETLAETKSEIKSSTQAEVKLAYYEIIKKELDNLRLEITTKTQRVDDLYNSLIGQLDALKGPNIEQQLADIKNKVTQRVELNESYNSLISLLAKAEEIKNQRIISNVLNELTYAAYYLKKDAEMERIMSAYLERQDIDISETALVNTALITMNAYSTTGDEVEKEKTIKYLNRALKKVNDYGEALGLKMELFMIEYEKEANDNEKLLIKNEIQILIQQVLRSNIASMETIQRYERVQKSAAKSNHIEMLYTMFPKEMEQMKSIAEAYRVKDSIQSEV